MSITRAKQNVPKVKEKGMDQFYLTPARDNDDTNMSSASILPTGRYARRAVSP